MRPKRRQRAPGYLVGRAGSVDRDEEILPGVVLGNGFQPRVAGPELTADAVLIVVPALIELTAADVADAIDAQLIHLWLEAVGPVVAAEATGRQPADVALHLRLGKAQVEHAVEGFAELAEQLVQSERLGGTVRISNEEEVRLVRSVQAVAGDRGDDFFREQAAGVHDLGGSDPQLSAPGEVGTHEIAEGDPRHSQGLSQQSGRGFVPEHWRLEEDDAHEPIIPWLGSGSDPWARVQLGRADRRFHTTCPIGHPLYKAPASALPRQSWLVDGNRADESAAAARLKRLCLTSGQLEEVRQTEQVA
nr:hypothetical protein [Kitasatospora mediocidica]